MIPTPRRAGAAVRLSNAALIRHYEGFLRSLRRQAPETRGTYQRALREFLRWFRADRHCRFEQEDILRYRRYLLDQRRLSAVSVSTYLTAVRRFCEYLLQHRVISENPARHVGGGGRPASHSRKALSADQVQALINAVHPVDEMGLRDLACIRLMVCCGLSEIELVRADVEDLCLASPCTTLRVQGKGRTSKDAVVQVPREVRETLEQYLSVRGPAAPSDPLFASAGNRTRGERMTTRGVRERVNFYLDRAGVKQGMSRRITPYSLRHTAALMLAASGATADEIKDRMRLGSMLTAMLYVNRK
ncbi:MAG TPA: tyrosine-type recombinase/integrase [Bacteroidota bacterium]